VLQELVNGLLLGGVYALASVGFALVWGVMNEINIAHAAAMVLGAYTSYELFRYLHVDPLLSIPFAMLLVFSITYPLQRYLLNRALPHGLVITLASTFGLNLLLENLIQYIFTGDYRSITPSYVARSLHLGPIVVPFLSLLVFVMGLLAFALLYLFLERSWWGLAIRSTALHREAARIVGLPVERIYALVFALGSALAAAAGVMIATTQSLYPGMGDRFLTKIFVITALGGFGSLPGALLGSMLFALIEVFASTYLGPSLVDLVAFSLLVLTLIVRPQGLLGRKFYGEEGTA
jgi:branched-chain amino acid transport system permease protein